MRGELRDQRHRAVHARDDGAVAGLQVGADKATSAVSASSAAEAARSRRGGDAATGPGRTGDSSKSGLLACMSGRHRHHIGGAGNRVKPKAASCHATACRHDAVMRVVATSNDPVRLSFLTALLADAGIACVRAGRAHQRGGGQHRRDPAPAGGGRRGRAAGAAGAGGGGGDLRFRASSSPCPSP